MFSPTSNLTEYDYNPFGKQSFSSGSKANDFAFRFSTKYFDSETGLYYYGYRYYSSDLGRWINRDPIGEAGGVNIYGFVNNNPISRIDYVGALPLDEFVKRIEDDRPKYKGQKDEPTYWLAIIKRYYDGSLLRILVRDIGSEKHMLTRNDGVIDLQHYMNITYRTLAESAGKDINKVAYNILKVEDNYEKNNNRPQVEDSPSNYRGTLLAFDIKEKNCTTYDEVADLVLAHVRAFEPLKTKAEEDAFLKYYGYGEYFGIGRYVHQELSVKNFTIFEYDKTTKTAVPTNKYIDIKIYIKKALGK